MSRPRPLRPRAQTADGPARGTWLVAGLLLLGLMAAVTGVWFQRSQTRRCLEFYGPAAARRVAAAPRVELLLLNGGASAGAWSPPAAERAEHVLHETGAGEAAATRAPARLVAARRIDVSKAPGLVHLRRGLVEDANFRWQDDDASVRLPPGSWDVAFEFADDGGSRGSSSSGEAVGSVERGRTTLVLDFDPAGGHLAVVGRPGRIGLGRIEPGLEKWIRSTLASAP